MHECPECGQACDCDGEDTWNDIGSSDWLNCSHECEFDDDDFDGGYSAYQDDLDDDDPKGHSLECTCETCIQNHPERMIYLDDDDDAEQCVQPTDGGLAQADGESKSSTISG